MTISTTASSTTVVLIAAQTVVPFSFIADAASDITVQTTNTSTGLSTTLTSSQYTVTLNSATTGQLWSVGGYVTLNSAPGVGYTCTITRTLPLQQLISIQNQGDFAPQVTEQALDTLCMEIQQVSARTGSYRGVWATGVVYSFGDIVQDGINGAYTNNIYVCAIANTSGVWATDLAAGDWVLSISVATLQPPGSFLPLSGGTVSGNLTVSGTTALAGVSASGNATVGGTLGVTGAITALNLTASQLVATNSSKVLTSVTALPSGSTVAAGNLASQGLATPFTTSGTFTTPSTSSTATIYYYRMVGGGGGGGGANGSYAQSGGGGAGAYAEGTFTGVASSTGITITIGAAGTAGSSSGGTGGTGGSTIIGSPVSVTCSGGVGGGGSTATSSSATNGGAGGTVTGSPNLVSSAGQNGYSAWALTSTGIWGGNGASSPLGGGGISNINLTGVGTISSASATGYGAGGQGTSGTGAIGGLGRQGFVEIIQLTP